MFLFFCCICLFIYFLFFRIAKNKPGALKWLSITFQRDWQLNIRNEWQCFLYVISRLTVTLDQLSVNLSLNLNASQSQIVQPNLVVQSAQISAAGTQGVQFTSLKGQWETVSKNPAKCAAFLSQHIPLGNPNIQFRSNLTHSGSSTNTLINLTLRAYLFRQI